MKPRLQSVCAASAVLAGVAAIVAPVVSQVSGSIIDACFARKHALWTSYILYTQDYNNYAVPADRYPMKVKPPNVTHAQFLIPYQARWGYLRCPSDPNAIDAILQLDANDAPPTSQVQREYDFAMRADAGYNYVFFAPEATYNNGISGSYGIQLSRVLRPATTILYLDSIWNRDTSGLPKGGGNWIVDPPAVSYRTPNGTIINTIPSPSGNPSVLWLGGWRPSHPLSWVVYGGAWPWHTSAPAPGPYQRLAVVSRAAVIFFDGHSAALTPDQLGVGCDVRDEWQGVITDIQQYQWSTVY